MLYKIDHWSYWTLAPSFILRKTIDAHVVVVVILGFKSLQIIILGIVDSESIAQIEECVARAVVGVFTALVNVGVGIAVQDGNSHRVVPPWDAGVIFQPMKAHSACGLEEPINTSRRVCVE